MASFIEDLWNSIFTPGTPPTLLAATNASFAALQFLLFILLITTYSVHFLVLSLLSGALWYSINWFVREVREFQATQAKEGSRIHKEAVTARVPGAMDTTESETETEGVPAVDTSKSPLSPAVASSSSSPAGPAAAAGAMRPPPVPSKATSSGASAAPAEGAEEVKQRNNNNPTDSSGYVSTDSEWEKVDEKER
ncbi:hypothetical protein VTO42DRAFT_2370 [Malbranchea cinnamomea]